MDQYFSSDVKVRIVKRFYNETSAKLYQSKMLTAGVESFVSNSITSTLLPFSEGGFILHVREEDLELAQNIITQIEHDLENAQEQDFRDADLADINYEKEVWESQQRIKNSTALSGFLFLLILFIIVALFMIIRSNIEQQKSSRQSLHLVIDNSSAAMLSF